MRVLVAGIVAYLAARLHLLRRRVAVDPKTGLLTPSAWMQATTRRLRRPGTPGVAVLMVDIDQFKKVNDDRGHLGGDAVLASVARTMRTGLRSDDIAARFGGDEFAALLTNVTENQAVAIAERIQQQVALSNSVTVSIGVAAEIDPRATDLRTLLIRADAALYRAKRSGGNTVTNAAERGRHAAHDLIDGAAEPLPERDSPKP